MTDFTTRMDAAAIGLSAACVVHCLALPIAAALLPAFGGMAEAEWIHWLFVVLALPVTIIAMRRRSTGWAIRTLAGLGLIGLVVGALEYPSEHWETPMTVAGGLVLALAHTFNAVRTHRLRHHH